MADEDAKEVNWEDTRMLRDLRHIRRAAEMSVRLQAATIGVLCLIVGLRLAGLI